MKFSDLLSVIVITSFISGSLVAQTQKVPLSINDSRLWRMHAVALSDNGEWYTTHYHLLDKDESKKDTTLEKLIEQTSSEFYDENNQTDVLYVHHVKEGIKYKIPDGNNPVFSSASDWIAYKITLESDAKAADKVAALAVISDAASTTTAAAAAATAARIIVIARRRRARV